MLDLFGNKWTLLVIRDLVLGRSRFKDFASWPEGISTNILNDRLERLLEGGVIRHIPADGSKHLACEITDKCRAFRRETFRNRRAETA